MEAQDINNDLNVRVWDSIPVRLGLGVLIITLAALALTLLIVARQEERHFTEAHLDDAHKIAAVTATDLGEQMMAGGDAAVWSAISVKTVQRAQMTGASRILLLNKDGVVRAGSESATIGTRIETRANPECPACDSARAEDFPASAILATSEGFRRLRVVNPIPTTRACKGCHTQDGEMRSFLTIDFDLSGLDNSAKERRQSILLVGLISGIAMLVLTALLFKWLVLRPVHALNWSVQRLASGDLGTRAEVIGRNELTLLARYFNHMAERIEEQVARIESESKYRLLFESSRDALLVARPPSWRFTDANQAALQLFGATSKADFTALGPWDVSPERQPDGRPSPEKGQEIAAIVLQKGSHLFEWELRRMNGETFAANVLGTRMEAGGQVFLQATVRDITERKRQEQALRESEERFKSILENVVEMFFIADASLHAVYLSPRCLSIYGYSSNEMTARPTLWMDAIHPEDRGAVARHAAEMMRSGAKAVYEYRIVRKDGSVRWVRSVANPILAADEKPQRVYGTVMDVTEFESLRLSLKEKEVLLKEIHHRVKNNLQIVISLMRLESRAFSEARVAAALKDLEARIRAMALVHEHLYHSSDLAKIGFEDYLRRLCQDLFRTYGADGDRIRLGIDAEAVALDIERAIPCGLIINELLTNAIKYAFPGNRKGVIRVAIRNTPDGGAEIVVGDDGIGIADALDIRNTQTLGLQLVTTLAENQLNGRVELNRAGGTQFRIQFRL